MRTRQVALALPLGVHPIASMIHGVMAYAHEHGPWQLLYSPELFGTPLESLAGRELHAIVTFARSRREAARIARMGVPAINLSSWLENPPLPTVMAENRSTGRLAFQHLVTRGFRRFAYYGLRDVFFGRERGKGFVEALAAAGFACSEHYTKVGADNGRPSLLDLRELKKWLSRLEPPVGLFAVNDYRGRVVIDACAALGLRVPDDVAVVAVDNDPLICEMMRPSLSSVVLPAYEIGYRGAAALDDLMAGRRLPRTVVRIPASEVVARGSTDSLGCEDAMVVQIARLVRERLAEGLNIDQMAAELKVSRRMLEKRFRAALRMTPHDFVVRSRLQEARRLLGEQSPRLSLAEIARRCGFGTWRRMNDTFLRVDHVPAQALRRSRK